MPSVSECQISWLIPTLIPLLWGIGIGVIAKKVLKIAVAIIERENKIKKI